MSISEIDCGEPDDIEHAKVIYKTSKFGHRAKYSCHRGYSAATYDNIIFKKIFVF